MSSWGLGFIGLIYAYCSFDMFRKGDLGHAVAFAGWALGQIGMVYAVLK